MSHTAKRGVYCTAHSHHRESKEEHTASDREGASPRQMAAWRGPRRQLLAGAVMFSMETRLAKPREMRKGSGQLGVDW